MRDANYEINESGIAIVSIDMAGKLNIMNDAYVAMLDEVLARLEAERENFAGVIVTSAKDGFVAGGDVNKILALRDAGGTAAQAFYRASEGATAALGDFWGGRSRRH